MIAAAEIALGLIAGVVVSGGIFAFIVVIGIVPRLVQRTKTANHIILYESMITLGGVAAGLTMLVERLPFAMVWAEPLVGAGYGVFLGCLAVAIAEVLNVIPILCRRLKAAKDLPWVMLVLALGKAAGVLVYYFVPGFLMIE